jgi:hypothetical protein
LQQKNRAWQIVRTATIQRNGGGDMVGGVRLQAKLGEKITADQVAQAGDKVVQIPVIGFAPFDGGFTPEPAS